MSAPTPEAVLVTGAATGIGAAAARKLADRGFRVFAGVHTTRPASSATGIEAITLDVTDLESVAASAATIRERLGEGGLRAVVNNAGVIVRGGSSSCRSASWSASSRSTRSGRST